MKTLNDCIYQTVHRNTKPLKAIAEEIGMSENYLTRAALPDQEESDTGSGCRYPLKKIIPLIRATGDFSVLDFIERSLGRVAVPLPEPLAGANIQSICHLTLRSVTEFGHLMTQVDNSIGDQFITPAEKEVVVKEGYEAVQAIIALVKYIESQK
ncbi:MAG: phage regulatory CII family protein [Syntrophus sp. (in: bacteria)]